MWHSGDENALRDFAPKSFEEKSYRDALLSNATGSAEAPAATEDSYKNIAQFSLADAPNPEDVINNGDLSKTETEALHDYSAYKYEAINNGLRDGDLNPKLKPDIAAIDSALSKSTASEDLTLFRGYSGPAMEVGKESWDKGFVSTSTATGIAVGFADANSESGQGRTILAIHVPEGSNAIAVHGIYNEKEVVLGRSSGFRVTSSHAEKIKDSQGSTREYTVYHADYIPPKGGRR